jgi:tyrosinase
MIYRSKLSALERRNYIDAVLCLGKKPARTPAPTGISEGAKSLYGAFVVTPIQQTRTIHFTVRHFRCDRCKTKV